MAAALLKGPTMTIAAAYLTSEGVVLGADSTTTVSSGSGVSQLLNHAQKVFEIGEGSRMGACTYGAGVLGSVSHRTLIARLGDWVAGHSVQETANKLVELADEATDGGKNLNSLVGYFIGGWNEGTRKPDCCHILIHPGEPPAIQSLVVGHAAFSGQPLIFTRVFRGFDPMLSNRLHAELANRLNLTAKDRITPDVFNDAFEKAFKAATKGLEIAGHKDLPIREAIDYVYAYLHVTIKAFKFRSGPPPCGGPIEIGFITTDRRFRWVNHKAFATAIMDHGPIGIKE